MNHTHVARITGVFLLGALLCLMSGCGYKNAPVPPQVVVPAAISDLTYKTDADGVQLSWSYPTQTIGGKALEDISSFELYRAEVLLEDFCATCPIPFGEPMTLDGGATFDGKERRKAHFATSFLRPGCKYFFKVRSRTSWWADSADSNIVTFVWFQPAASPEGVTAIPGDQMVTIKWQPVTTLADGSPAGHPIKYQVLRSVGGKDFVKLGGPVAVTEYVDRQVTNGLRYFYTIQSMMVLGDELVSGGIRYVGATPIDLTPPLPPTGVNVVRTGVGIKVFWDKSRADDIDGYRVYRRAADKKVYELLGEVESEYAIYVDAKAQDNVRYYYAISAFDLATPPNESKKSREATTRY